MNQTEAKKELRRLFYDGHPYEEIAALLHSAGYKSPRTGKPLSKEGVNQWALRIGLKKGQGSARPKGKAAARAGRERPGQDVLGTVRAILAERGMTAARKVEVALLLLNR